MSRRKVKKHNTLNNNAPRNHCSTTVNKIAFSTISSNHLPVVVSKTKQCFNPPRTAKPSNLTLSVSTTCQVGSYQQTDEPIIQEMLKLANFTVPGLETCSVGYSGTGGPNEHAAREIAELLGCRTIYDIPAATALSDAKLFERLSFAEASKPWDITSAKFAETSKGTVYIAAEGDIKPTSTLYRVELPILQENSAVTAIVYLRTFGSHLALVGNAAKEGAVAGATSGMITGFVNGLPLSALAKEVMICTALYTAFGPAAPCLHLAQKALSAYIPEQVLGPVSAAGLLAHACSLPSTNPLHLLTQAATAALLYKPAEAVGNQLAEWVTQWTTPIWRSFSPNEGSRESTPAMAGLN